MKQKVRLLNISIKQVNIFKLCETLEFIYSEKSTIVMSKLREILFSSFCGILKKTQLELPNKLTVIYYVQKIVMTSYPGTLAPF